MLHHRNRKKNPEDQSDLPLQTEEKYKECSPVNSDRGIAKSTVWLTSSCHFPVQGMNTSSLPRALPLTIHLCTQEGPGAAEEPLCPPCAWDGQQPWGHSQRTQRLERSQDTCQRWVSRAGAANTTLARRFPSRTQTALSSFECVSPRTFPLGLGSALEELSPSLLLL